MFGLELRYKVYADSGNPQEVPVNAEEAVSGGRVWPTTS